MPEKDTDKGHGSEPSNVGPPEHGKAAHASENGPSGQSLADQLETFDQAAQAQGISLVEILYKTAQNCFGVDLRPPPEGSPADVLAKASGGGPGAGQLGQPVRDEGKGAKGSRADAISRTAGGADFPR